MSYVKRIACLANSRKYSGRCVAGKEVLERGYGGWVRPVSDRPLGEVSEEERRYENGRDPRVYDVIDVPLLEVRRHGYQTENHLLDASRYWVKVGEIGWGDLEILLDPSAPLWANGDSTYNGVNDRVGAEAASCLDHSLRFIRVERLTVQVRVEGAMFGNPKRKVRANFNHHGTNYCLVVTDPVAERAFLGRPDGVHQLRDAYLCVSLSEMYQGACYKLVATIFTEGSF